MRIDVLLGEAPVVPADVADRVVVVIDVLRAATTVATALANGARAVIPFETVDETIMRSKAYARGEVKLAGERRMVRIAGFDLGKIEALIKEGREAIEKQNDAKIQEVLSTLEKEAHQMATKLYESAGAPPGEGPGAPPGAAGGPAAGGKDGVIDAEFEETN